MKNISLKKITLVILPLVLLYGCTENDSINSNSIYGSGKIVSETREVNECNGIKISNYGNVYLTQDSVQKIRVEADDNIMDYVITKEQDGVLQVGLKDGSYSKITLNFYVSLKTISSLSIEGSGSILSENQLTCDKLSTVINGSGNIIVKGESNYLYGVINGSGNINAEKLTASKCDAVINGSGACTLFVTDALNASINGSGTIIYYGKPPNVNTSISGSGSIVSK